MFPHEVVGFSGGAKYLFPGISGGDFLHFFHWLGAVLTCKRIIGVKDTPVRRLIDRAMEAVPVPIRCLSMVVRPDASLCGLFAGEVREAWSQAADLSARVHVVTKPRPFHTVLGRASDMYDEIWTAGKVMYKLEQVVARGGRLIIYAPHVREVSRTLGGYDRARRLPHAGLLPDPDGPLPGRPARGAGPLDARARDRGTTPTGSSGRTWT